MTVEERKNVVFPKYRSKETEKEGKKEKKILKNNEKSLLDSQFAKRMCLAEGEMVNVVGKGRMRLVKMYSTYVICHDGERLRMETYGNIRKENNR